LITLYKKDGITKIGDLTDCIECLVEEERNGLFEVSLVYPLSSNLCSYLVDENIIECNANDTLLNQKFRIYMTRKVMDNMVEVYARHISFDLMYDYIDNVSFENQSCEYVLNQLFRNSNFSKHYKGYSDIVNAQNYSMSMANVLEAIGGKKGSIIDTFGTGAEILRDNENIHVLNKRGYDNEVTIEYKKNLIGFELEEDTTDLVTRISPYAKYNDSETNEEIIVKADYVDSTLIANYSHPYIKSIDYSDKFGDGEIPTVSKLQDLARKEYKNNKVDIPKQNFKIEFIPLSKCVGYEGLEDKISLCDTVTIIDTRYNIKTQSKVIKTVFNVLKNRYESMELGEPRTSLGNVIGGGNNEPIVGPPGPQGPPGQDGNIGDFPNTLPSTPVLESFVYGFSNIELSWTFENKVYYSYELYGSKTKDFKPNTFDLIFEGQASTYMFQAKPNETWYFKVCAINTHGERTNFSNQVTVNTTKIEDLSNYVENMAISEALIGTLSLDRGWIGTLKGNYIDARQLSVTDGNGKRTLDIDSFGNVNLDVTSLKIHSTTIDKVIDDSVNTTVNSILDIFKDGVISDVEKKILKEKKENLLREKADILAQTEIIKQSTMLVNTSELIDLKQSESNYISSIDNLVAIIDKLLEGGESNG
jgi:phage minor structural protein, N-terminal domain protein